MTTRLSILGSTGSIGRSTMEVLRHFPDRFKVTVLAAGGNIEIVSEQIEAFRPEVVAMADPEAAAVLRERFPDVYILAGNGGVEEAAGIESDISLCAIVGAAGLRPVVRAIETGHRIALANKEPLVMAGETIMARARARGVEILPVDSEHNAIFQCLNGNSPEDVHAIHLTASGGPFYRTPKEEMAGVSPAQATNHPTWDMGDKISVDSATLMNKGLEVIEAHWLFNIPFEKIKVIIHPQSVVHSLVEFVDGHILAHLGVTSMKFPILYALSWPDRLETPMQRLDLSTLSHISFDRPDFGKFPCLQLALDAGRAGGTMPAILNAANEVAVAAFCARRIAFLQISEVVTRALAEMPATSHTDLESIMEADTGTRTLTSRIIEVLE